MKGPAGSRKTLKGGGAGFLAVLLSLALAAPAAAAAASGTDGGEVTPGKGVGPIALGMTVDDLFRLWGPPVHTERETETVFQYDYEQARGAVVYVKGDRVLQILAVGRDWSTTNGIRIGATRPEVVAFFGRPDEQQEGPTRADLRYLYRRRGIAFTFKDRAVTGITVLAAEGEEAPKGGESDDEVRRRPFLPGGSSTAPAAPRY